MKTNNMPSVEEEGKVTAIVAYLTLIGALIAIFMNLEPKNPFARFHIRQAFGLHLLLWAMGIVLGNFDLWMIHASYLLLFFALWVYGFSGAIRCKWNSIPIAGPWFRKWFTFIQ